jgi:hypothetical protein
MVAKHTSSAAGHGPDFTRAPPARAGSSPRRHPVRGARSGLQGGASASSSSSAMTSTADVMPAQSTVVSMAMSRPLVWTALAVAVTAAALALAEWGGGDVGRARGSTTAGQQHQPHSEHAKTTTATTTQPPPMQWRTATGGVVVARKAEIVTMPSPDGDYTAHATAGVPVVLKVRVGMHVRPQTVFISPLLIACSSQCSCLRPHAGNRSLAQARSWFSSGACVVLLVFAISALEKKTCSLARPRTSRSQPHQGSVVTTWAAYDKWTPLFISQAIPTSSAYVGHPCRSFTLHV